MKKFLSLILAVNLALALQAQTYTMNWNSSLVPAWATGLLNGRAGNIGGSGVRCDIQLTKSGGIFTNTLGAMGGPMTPTVAATTFRVPGSTKNLQISLDFNSRTNYADVVFSFNRPVFNASFLIADIDRLTGTMTNYLDRVSITGFNGTESGFPVITKYDAVTDPDFLIITGNTAHVNPGNDRAENTASDATDQRGTIRVHFQGVYITSFRIRYDNLPAADANPTVQNISIGDIRFNTSIPLPVSLETFDGRANDNGSISLNWSSSAEAGFDRYEVERSGNGSEFHKIGEEMGSGNAGRNSYDFIDTEIKASKYYYRLKMIDLDGSYGYSKTIALSPIPLSGTKAYPSVFSNDFSLAFNSARAENVLLVISDFSGRSVYMRKINAKQGANHIQLDVPEALPSGQYLVSVGSDQIVRVIKQ